VPVEAKVLALAVGASLITFIRLSIFCTTLLHYHTLLLCEIILRVRLRVYVSPCVTLAVWLEGGKHDVGRAHPSVSSLYLPGHIHEHDLKLHT